MKQQSAIFVAILLGATIIAAAIYLRPAAPVGQAPLVETLAPPASATAPAAPTAPSTRAETAAPPAAQPAAQPVPSAPAAPGAALDQAALQAAVERALTPARSVWRAQCWDLLTKDAPGTASTRFALTLQFAADGREISRGMISPRDAGRPDVNLCVNRLPTELLQLEPLGAPASVTLEIVLP